MVDSVSSLNIYVLLHFRAFLEAKLVSCDWALTNGNNKKNDVSLPVLLKDTL